jgi:hypothetical protein
VVGDQQVEGRPLAAPARARASSASAACAHSVTSSPCARQLPSEDGAVDQVVVHHQHMLQRDRLLLGSAGSLLGQRQGQPEAEAGPCPGSDSTQISPAHHLDQPLG